MFDKIKTGFRKTMFWGVTSFDVVACAFLLWFFSFFAFGSLSFEVLYEGEKTYISAPSFEMTAATDYHRSKLNDVDKLAYDELEKALRSFSNRKSVTTAGSDSDLQDICQAVLADNPDIFWADTKIGYHTDGNGNYVVELFYIFDDPDYANAKHLEYTGIAEEIARECSGKSDREKILYAHDWVCEKADYEENDDDQSMYSVFEGGASVCAGYSRAFQFLCQAMGVACVYVPGEAGTGDSSEAHAWNIALMDSQPCYVDTTWDDKARNSSRPWTMLNSTRFSFTHHPEDREEYYDDLVGETFHVKQISLDNTVGHVNAAGRTS